MKYLKFGISDADAGRIEQRAVDESMTLQEFVSKRVGKRIQKIIAQTANSWVTEERWDELVRGETCDICRWLSNRSAVDDNAITVGELGLSTIRLHRNQFLAGYCVLVCHRHVREPFELTEEEQHVFFEDLMRAGRAIDAVMNPAKLNFEIQGNATPHLHCHIKPRYRGDTAPGIPIDQNEGRVELTESEYMLRIEALRTAMGLAAEPSD